MPEHAEFDRHPPRRGTGPLAYRIRAAVSDDFEAVARISADREGLDAGAIREAVRIDIARSEDSGAGRVFVAEIEDAVVAYGRVRGFRHEADGLPVALPEGWYLNGVVVDPGVRRRGIGAALTEARIDWVRERAAACHYVTNLANRVSIAMHAQAGFVEIARGFDYPRAGLTADASAAFRRAL